MAAKARRIARALLLCAALALSALSALGGDEPTPGLDLSTKKDALRAIDQGIQWLKARQAADGSWDQPPQPAVTAFATRAILGDPAREPGKLDASAGAALEFIASCARKDGGIYRDSPGGPMSNCSTAASLLALAGLPAGAGARQERYEPAILAARAFLARAQDRREGAAQFGGWACDGATADMKTTALAIEALAATQRLANADAEKSAPIPADPDWAAAVVFLSRCQDLPEAEAPGVGGFSNNPDPGSVAGAKPQARHADGSATALGLRALLESNVARRDRRVLAAVGWLRANCALDDPAGGAPRGQGICFYYYSLAGALSLYGEEPLQRPGKRAADWRREMMIHLISLQRADANGLGYWTDDRADDAGKDAILATAYAVLTLETLANEPTY